MKRLFLPLVLVVGLAFSGCETTKAVYKAATEGYNLSATKAEGIVQDDQIVIRSEQALAIGLDVFDTFLKLERANQKGLEAVSPKIHEFAENVRRNGPKWLKSLETAHNAYKGNRNAENHATLMTAYRTVQSAIAESQKYIEKHSGV